MDFSIEKMDNLVLIRSHVSPHHCTNKTQKASRLST